MGSSRIIMLLCCVGYVVTSEQNKHTTRILNGNPTSILQYPVAAQLLLDSWGTQQFTQYCAGVILTVRHVISTAHCFHVNVNAAKNYTLPQFWKIRAGATYRSRDGSLHNVQSIVTHPGFDKVYYKNDIAVLAIVGSFVLSDRVKQATIPKQGTDVAENTDCTIIGWGAKKLNGPQANKLQAASLKIIDRNLCNNRYQTIGATITNTMICAGILDQGTVDGCYGDSGGPLICNGLIVGLVSFGYACGNPHYPGVYTRIGSFTNWIVQTVTTLS